MGTVKAFVLLILTVFASEKNNGPEYGEKNGDNARNSIVVGIKKDKYANVNKKSEYIGVSYRKDLSKWTASRRSKNENGMLYNGCYDDEETAAYASDTLACKLMDYGEEGHRLNFPDEYKEVYAEKKESSSKFIGVSYNKTLLKWEVRRRNKKEKKTDYNGYYDDEETAARASDTLARKLMKNGDQTLKLNFTNDAIDVHWEKESYSKFVGVSYNKILLKWEARRRSKKDNYKILCNGFYDDEETAARASDTLARKLMENGDQKLILNFPDDYREVCPAKKKSSKFTGVSFHKISSKWKVQRWNKNENMSVSNGFYDDEETAARASDTLAKILMKNGKQTLKLNFLDDSAEFHPEIQNKKRKRKN